MIELKQSEALGQDWEEHQAKRGGGIIIVAALRELVLVACEHKRICRVEWPSQMTREFMLVPIGTDALDITVGSGMAF